MPILFNKREFIANELKIIDDPSTASMPLLYSLLFGLMKETPPQLPSTAMPPSSGYKMSQKGIKCNNLLENYKITEENEMLGSSEGPKPMVFHK